MPRVLGQQTDRMNRRLFVRYPFCYWHIYERIFRRLVMRDNVVVRDNLMGASALPTAQPLSLTVKRGDAPRLLPLTASTMCRK